jgi:hypothetical protein
MNISWCQSTAWKGLLQSKWTLSHSQLLLCLVNMVSTLLEEVQSNIPAGPEEVGCNCRQHLATERGVAWCGVVEVHDCCKRCKGTLRLGCAVFDTQMERRANSNQIDFGTRTICIFFCILAHKSKGVPIPTQIGFDICILVRKLKPVLN